MELLLGIKLNATRLSATGSAGLINTISMMSQGHILAGVFGIVSTVGWAFQAFGGAFLYKRTWDFKNNHEGLDFQSVSGSWSACGSNPD